MSFCPKSISLNPGLPCGLCCIKIENLGVSRGKTSIINNINLHFRCGELTALVGPNGAGKSTLLKAVIGDIPYRGTISFQDSMGKRKGRPVVGYVPQLWDYDHGSPVSVCDLFAAGQKGYPIWLTRTKKIREMVRESLARVQAEYLIDRRLGELSGGEIQRVLLALAMEPVPDLLLLDEPVSGVDYQGRQLFYRTVSELKGKYHLSIILVSHDLELMKQFADRIVYLDKTVRSFGTPDQVLGELKVGNAFAERFYQDFRGTGGCFSNGTMV